jgi:hypothetical protein
MWYKLSDQIGCKYKEKTSGNGHLKQNRLRLSRFYWQFIGSPCKYAGRAVSEFNIPYKQCKEFWDMV